MKDLIKRLRKGVPYKTVRNDFTWRKECVEDTRLARSIMKEAADALERMTWNTDMEAAPTGDDILVRYDHEAAPYHTDETQTRLSNYACHAESGDFMDGVGVCIAGWCEGYTDGNEMEGEPESWMPASWFAKGGDGDYTYAVFPTKWMHLPPEGEAK